MSRNRIIITVGIILLVVLAGLVVYLVSQDSATFGEGTTQESSRSSDLNSADDPSTVRYLKIKELGVQLPISDTTLRKVSYSISTGYGGDITILSITNDRLKQITCPDGSGAGSFKQDILQYESEQAAKEGQPSNTTGVKQVGDNYYVFNEVELQLSNCVLSNEDQAALDGFKKAIQEGFQGIKAL